MLVSHIVLRCTPSVLVVSLAFFLCGVLADGEEIVPLEPWQGCDIFLAPSTTGWGVFAARDFVEGEHVDTSSLSVPTSDERDDGIIKTSVLNDYVYGYNRYPSGEYSTIVLHGSSMYFNHHPEPNVQVRVTYSNCFAFVTTRGTWYISDNIPSLYHVSNISTIKLAQDGSKHWAFLRHERFEPGNNCF
jgi:hypothetical protein